MTTGSRPPKRPVVGSRNPTGRPRKVAGRRDAASPGGPAEAAPGVEAPPAEAPPGDEPPADQPPAAEVAVEQPPTEEAPGEQAPADEPADERAEEPGAGARGRLLASGRATGALLAALVLLVGVLAAESWYLWFREDPVVSSGRPVVTGEIAHRAAVEAARQSTEEILSYGYQDFDAQVDEAVSKMDDSFAGQFRETAAGVRQEFIRKKTEQQVKVIGASVVQASSEQVQALLFLDQYVSHDGGTTDVTPFRALVTMVHTDSGWLVSRIQTG
jgi:Mce-associated membrane protein